jgi:hypothetical protein
LRSTKWSTIRKFRTIKTNNMNKEFIPYEQALALEELGFDELCISTIDQTGYIHIKGTEYPIRGDMWYNTIDAPLYQQAFRWFGKQFGLYSWVKMEHGYEGFIPTYYIRGIMQEDIAGGEFKTPEEAELSCLKKLIQIIKNK